MRWVHQTVPADITKMPQVKRGQEDWVVVDRTWRLSEAKDISRAQIFDILKDADISRLARVLESNYFVARWLFIYALENLLEWSPQYGFFKSEGLFTRPTEAKLARHLDLIRSECAFAISRMDAWNASDTDLKNTYQYGNVLTTAVWAHGIETEKDLRSLTPDQLKQMLPGRAINEAYALELVFEPHKFRIFN